MKKTLILILVSTISISIFSQSEALVNSSKIIYRNANTMKVINTTPTVETWKRVESSVGKVSGGNFGIGLHGAYAGLATNKTSLSNFEVGGNLFYNFSSKFGKSKFGLSIGFDYAQYHDMHVYQNNDSINKYYDLNAGIIICKYIGIGAAISLNGIKQAGPYVNIYLPVSEHFGFMLNGKIMFNYSDNKMQNVNEIFERWSVGGGIIFQIPTKL